VVHESTGFGGPGGEIAARVTERCFHHLEAPVLRVAGFDIPYPPPMLERHHLPGVDRILDAVARLQWESGRTAAIPRAQEAPGTPELVAGAWQEAR
jgi:pyruvate dehydrogenase E1 component beta subunit